MLIRVLSLFLLLMSGTAMAQQSTLSGNITDQHQEALIGVNVLIKGALKGTQTDAQGHFELDQLKAGRYTLTISYVGYKAQEITVDLGQAENHQLGAIALYEGNEILNNVVIQGERTNAFSRSKTAYVSKLPLKDMENTQVYSTVTNELLKSQVVTNFDDALKNATGVEQLWASTGRGGDGAGYYSLRGFSVQPQLVNGLPGLTNGTINPANIERIEVLKGPSATLFGNAVSSYGGLINVVTKKPYVGTGGSLSYTTGSFGLNQIVGDYNTPLGENEDIYFRLNTAHTRQQSFQDAGFQNSFFIAPSLSYKVNNRLSFSFYGEITQAEQTNPMMLFLNRSVESHASNLEELNYNRQLSFTSNDLTLENPTQNYRMEMSYKLSDAWQSQTLLSASGTSTNGYYSYLWETGGTGDNEFSRFISKQNAHTQTTDFQQNFTGDFKIGQLRNRLVVGFDYFTSTQTSNNSGYIFYGAITPDGLRNDSADFPLSQAGVDQALADQPIGHLKSRHSIMSSYVSNVINFTPRLSAMVGLRLDHFNNEGDLNNTDDRYEQTTLSPKVGVMYQPIMHKLSLFANYQNGFQNIAPQLVGDPESGPQQIVVYKPERANQFEFGVKSNFLEDRLNATVSYYNIEVSDRVMIDPENPFNKIQDGAVRSEGVEIEVNANPVKGLNLRAGFSHNESTTTQTDDPLILGQRPLEAGPKMLFNFWSSYQFSHGPVQGLGAGFGLNGASERYVKNYTTTGDFILPSYMVASASVYFQKDSYRISLKVNNLFDEEYYKGWTTITPQAPRAFLANFTYSF
ncbi:TonB-dependent receptor [Persicobacter psychrovividus]|uniref:TonB-dependent receptor n=1 Tax=Persicobacter psychrovividus TaxID=387638 RepID=A0ABN6LFU8_9BACT|nr:TonB-dependent receptor [Persicobacter psychrovividus]